MLEDDKLLFYQFQKDKNSPEYQSVFEKVEPKVSVVISTYNAGELLLGHSLKSVLNQTYTNLEIIIIGDGCTDNTEDLVKQVNDPRIIFENKVHEDPPENNTWALTGASAINRGLELCTGQYIACLDDDDFFISTKIEQLVNYNRKAKADILQHSFKIYYMYQYPNTKEAIQYKSPEVIPGQIFACGNIGTSTMFFHGWFSRVKIDLNAAPGEPGDWNRCRRMQEIGATISCYPEILTIMTKNFTFYKGRNRTKPWITTI